MKRAKAVAEGFVVGGEQGAFDHGDLLVAESRAVIFTKHLLGKKQYTAKQLAVASVRTRIPRHTGAPMTEAFVFDAIRTPRGKGKKDGSLYEVKPVTLLAGLLTDLQQRNQLRHRAGRRCGDGRGVARG